MTVVEITALAWLLIAGQCTPGPNNALLSASGMRFGYRATMPHALGIMFGHAFMEFMVALGLGKSYQAFPILDSILTYVAVALLSYLAFKVATAPVDELAQAKSSARPWRFWEGFSFQWINPKTWLIAIGVSGAFASGESTFEAASIIGLVTLTTAIISTQMWTIFGVAMARILDTPMKRRAFNVVMAGLMIWSVVLLLSPNYA